jgi:hypothetical protein
MKLKLAMGEKELDKWYAFVRQKMDIVEKIRFIQEIFFVLEEEGVTLPMGDYDEVQKYLNQILNKVE